MSTAFPGPVLLLGQVLAIVLCGAIGDTSVVRAQTEEEVFVVVRAGRVLTMAGPDLEDVEIVLVNGRIRVVGKNLSYPRTARVIDAREEVVMPGLIHPRTRWQLPGYSRAGVHGDMTVAKEVYASEVDFEPLLAAGFTTVCFFPEGTGVPGVGAIYRLAGPADQRELGPGYLRVTMTSPGRDKKVLRDAVTKARQEIEKVEKARKEWEAKQAQAKAAEAAKAGTPAGDKQQEGAPEGQKPDVEKKPEGTPAKKEESPSPQKKEPEKKEPEKKEPEKKEPEKKEPEKKDETPAEAGKPDVFTPPPIDPAVEPLVRWIRDKQGTPLLFEVSSASDYLHLEEVLDQARELPRSSLYLSGSYTADWHHVMAELAASKTLLLLPTGIGTLPHTATRFNLAGELALAGGRIVLVPRSDSPAGLERHWGQIADLVRAGLPRDQALQSLTLRPAEVLGIDARVGSIEKGKEADFIFLNGDPLTPHAKVVRVMTLGQIVWESEK